MSYNTITDDNNYYCIIVCMAGVAPIVVDGPLSELISLTFSLQCVQCQTTMYGNHMMKYVITNWVAINCIVVSLCIVISYIRQLILDVYWVHLSQLKGVLLIIVAFQGLVMLEL